MIISSIDIGTNTVLLLIAQTDPKNNKIIPLLNKYYIPRIGKNLKETGYLSAEAVDKLKEVLLEYKNLSEEYHSNIIIASATAAFRNAKNSREIIDHIKNETGIEIDIISSETEGLYAYLGVTSGLYEEGRKLIIDIGGGSTEIIIGEGDKVLLTKSFETGVLFSSEQFRMNKNYLRDLEKHYSEVFSDLSQIEIVPDKGYAIAGTPTTLAAIKLNLNEFDADVIEGTTLNKEYLSNFVSVYTRSSEAFNSAYYSVLQGREDLMLPGSMILLRIMENLNLEEVIVSTRGIRNGAVVNYLKNQG
jgi:exopolyphosphatase / guanosine-5'-triphosphate,3'-diphosphate pyrophosphatase